MMMKRKDKAPTLAQIRKVTGPHVKVWDDRDAGCYRATCAEGWAFEPGELHELVAVYDEFQPRGEALLDLAERLRPDSAHCEGPVVKCDAECCDWCDN